MNKNCPLVPLFLSVSPILVLGSSRHFFCRFSGGSEALFFRSPSQNDNARANGCSTSTVNTALGRALIMKEVVASMQAIRSVFSPESLRCPPRPRGVFLACNLKMQQARGINDAANSPCGYAPRLAAVAASLASEVSVFLC